MAAYASRRASCIERSPTPARAPSSNIAISGFHLFDRTILHHLSTSKHHTSWLCLLILSLSCTQCRLSILAHQTLIASCHSPASSNSQPAEPRPKSPALSRRNGQACIYATPPSSSSALINRAGKSQRLAIHLLGRAIHLATKRGQSPCKTLTTVIHIACPIRPVSFSTIKKSYHSGKDCMLGPL